MLQFQAALAKFSKLNYNKFTVDFSIGFISELVNSWSVVSNGSKTSDICIVNNFSRLSLLVSVCFIELNDILLERRV